MVELYSFGTHVGTLGPDYHINDRFDRYIVKTEDFTYSLGRSHDIVCSL